MQDSDGDVGHLCGTIVDVSRLEDVKTRLQGDIEEQKYNSSQPGSIGDSGKEDLQAEGYRDLGQTHHACLPGQVLVRSSVPQQKNRRDTKRGVTNYIDIGFPCPL